MAKLKNALLTALVALAIGGALVILRPEPIAATPNADPIVAAPSALWAWAGSLQPIERQVGAAMRAVVHESRVLSRALTGLVWDIVGWWGVWLKAAAFSLAVAVIAALADRGLLGVWRTEGLGVAVRDAMLMLYVYARLLLSGGVSVAPKLLFLAALIYGVVQQDFVPDTSWVPGRVEDVVFIVIATRAFIYACPDALLNEYAGMAVRFRRRVASVERLP